MTEGAAVSEVQLIAGLLLAVAVLLFLVLRTKIHVVLALVVAASIAGLVGGMAPDAIVTSITRGFGNTLATIGLVIGFGVMMGRLLEVSGAAERMARSLINALGAQREEWALAGTGYTVSIAVFCDSAFVILVPMVRALARAPGKSVLTLGIALAGGLLLTHHAIPPTPGPLGVAGIFGVDIGLMIFWGFIFTLPGIGVLVWYARAMGPRIEAMILRDTGEQIGSAPAVPETDVTRSERKLPSLGLSVAPIAVPILLIFLSTLTSSILTPANDALLVQIIRFIGNPVIAVGIGLAIAAYALVPGRSREQVLADLEKGVESAGIIILVTGAGGALGAVLRDSGAGEVIGASVVNLPLPAVLIPFIIATLMRLIQGSGTVAMITGASISAPILMTIPDVNMVLAAQAAATGSMVFAYFNDSYFWVVNRMLGVKNAKHQILTWSVPTTLCWLSALAVLLIANFFFG